MERLSHSAVGTAGNAVLRYGYVPPSLLLMQGRQRDRRTHALIRLAFSVLVVLAAVGAYRWQRLALVSAETADAARIAPAAPGPERHVSLPSRSPATGNPEWPQSIAAAGLDARIGTAATRAAAADVQATVPAGVGRGDVLQSPAARAREAEQNRVLAPAATASPVPMPVPPLAVAALQRSLDAITGQADGSYGISVVDLTSGQELDINATTPMNAASVNKLEILASLYHEVERGRLRVDQTLTTTPTDMQDYGTGVIRYQPVGTSYSVDQLATLLIEQSDNTASYMLSDLIGVDTIDALIQRWGLHTTSIDKDVSSPQDAARFMALLYQGKLANAVDTRHMLTLLTHTAFNDRIPAGLPGGIPVAHKIGTQVNVENDVAIVLLPGRPYILSVFAKHVTEERAVPVEQAISRTVYQFEDQAKGAS